jgi:hypothetical protein
MMSRVTKLDALLYAMEMHVELLEEEIADTPEPKDENNMKPLECFVYGVKTARKQEVEVLKDCIKNTR